MLFKNTLLTIGLTITAATFANAQNWQQGPLNEEINSIVDERAPVLSPDGQILYFVRASHPENAGGKKDKGDIWQSERMANGSWTAPVLLKGRVNNEQRNEILGLSADGKTMFVNDAYRQDGRTGISVSQLEGGAWSAPRALELPYFKNASKEISGALSADGKVMFLSIESFNSRGAEDLYVLFRKGNGSYGDPKNLGSVINSAFQEVSPYLAPDNKTLYFASNGYGGAGSFDLFRSERLDDSFTAWSKPENLGPEVNTKGKETYFRIINEGKQGLYVSTQDSNGYGDLKVYTFPEPQEVVAQAEIQVEEATITTEISDSLKVSAVPEVKEVLGRRYLQLWVVDENSNELIAAEVEAVLEDSLAQIIIPHGHESVPLPQGKRLKEFRIKSEGYWGIEQAVNELVEEAASAYRFKLKPLEVGMNVRLDNILFQRGTAIMLEGGDAQLDKMYELLSENPNMVIEVAGHTDNRGSTDANRKLSLQRAESIKAYLVEKGIKKKRVEAKGYGSAKPVADNKREETRKLNRRVEFTILAQ
ncbi:OmpA family protein [Persicobacter diffluens]|uniref:Membrane protein n=1 Tax=Persicobacter diffluens TaxID=981 RepID=A0AAN4VXG9_9BACT|nr:membrane protein [Persicobacter diffluens]